MKSDFHSALASVQEVAVFAWSLLELLLTRILPLFAFLIGHFLLHCCSLVASIFTAESTLSRRRHHARRGTSYPANEELQLFRAQERQLFRANEEQQQQLLRGDDDSYGDLQRPTPTTAAISVEDILNDLELQEQPQPPPAAQPAVTTSPVEDHLPQDPHLKPQPPAAQSAINHLPQEQPSDSDAHTADVASPTNDEQIAIPAAAAEPVSDLSHSAQSDAEAAVDVQKLDVPSDLSRDPQPQPSDPPVAKSVTQPRVDAVTDVKGGNGSKTLKTASTPVTDGQPDGSKTLKTASTPVTSGSMKKRPFTRVLPPSLSQIKRTLMQRSRRGSPSSPLKTTSPNLKRHSPRVRKLTSTMKSSPSYDNFVRNFRKHFLMDSPKNSNNTIVEE